jgi:uncharacterized integral membrane protein
MQKNQFIFIMGLLFSVFVALFALSNNQTVAINLLLYKFEGASQAVIIFVSAALGAIIVTLLGLVRYLKLKSELRKTKKENTDLTAQLENLTEQIKVMELRNEIEANDLNQDRDHDVVLDNAEE